MMARLQGIVPMMAFALLSACAMHMPANQPLRAADSTVNWTSAKTVAVGLSDFEFTPDHLTLRAGQPVRLMLTNTGSGKHDFSAPAFFAAASFRVGGTPPIAGKVSLAGNQKAEIDLVPGTPGQYPLDCTEFLHDMLGMTGQITVTAP
jgi:uncharacterized cupredoxin-like copper-binding protein